MNKIMKKLLMILVVCIGFTSCKKDNEWLSKDVLERVPKEMLNKAKKLGLEINGGKTPPNIEGRYSARPVILVNSIDKDDDIGGTFGNGIFAFSEQDNESLTVLSYIEEMGVGNDTSIGSFITGNSNNFTVFVVMPHMYFSTSYFFISGKIESGGIRNLHFVILNEEVGRLFKDGDGFSERRTTSTRSSIQKVNETSSETLFHTLKSSWID